MRAIDRLARKDQQPAAYRELFPEESPISSAAIEPHYIDDVLEGVCVDGLPLGEC